MAAPASATVPAGEGGTPSSARRPGARELARRFLTLREGSIIVVTILAALYFSLKNDRFFTHANFVTLLPYFAPFAILAVGEVLLMVAGEIDLSIGSVYLFAPFMFYEFNEAGLGLTLCLIGALLLSAIVGLINGVITEVFGVSSFITTLGMLLGLGGLTLIISHAAVGRDAGRRGDLDDEGRHPRGQRADDHAAGAGQPRRHVRADLRRRDSTRS